MDKFTYCDMKIFNDDVVLDEFNQPVLIYDLDVVEQDIRHAIRESRLLELMIGELSNSQRAISLNKLRILVESDPRVSPGTSEMNTKDIENIFISADTEFGPVNLGASI